MFASAAGLGPPGQPGRRHHPRMDALADTAAVVRFLCNPGAGFITSQNMQVNGGSFPGEIAPGWIAARHA
jgi:hypothetical protein